MRAFPCLVRCPRVDECCPCRSPKLTRVSRRIPGVWFLLHREQFHLSRTAQASAPLSTGVLTVRGTPGQCLARKVLSMPDNSERAWFSPVPTCQHADRLPQNTRENKENDF